MAYAGDLDGVTVAYFRWPLWLDRLIAVNAPPIRTLGMNVRRRRWLDALAGLPGFHAADVIHLQGLEDGEAILSEIQRPGCGDSLGAASYRWLTRGLNPESDEALRRRIQRIRDNVRLVAIGHAQAQALTSAGMPPTDVIPPGIDLQRFTRHDRGEARQRVGLPTDGKIVLFVGRLAEDKNVGGLLTAFAQLAAHTPLSQGRHYRKRPAQAGPRATQRIAGIEESTIFVPFVRHQDLPSYYQAADVTVVPSNYLETFCMVALKAIACGCPLIVTEHIPEILEEAFQQYGRWQHMTPRRFVIRSTQCSTEKCLRSTPAP